MVKLINEKVWLKNGLEVIENPTVSYEEARKNTMAYNILQAHNTSGDADKLKIKFDAMASHDITYVGIIQQARASGMKEFPIPYALTNCHNSLCAVGGTINEDDHVFGLSAAKKYGGIYVPANQSVIHSYGREQMAKCGAMLLGSDSHTRYGALGTMAVGEGGPELAKQLLKNTWDVKYPKVVLVYLTGTPKRGVGPHDVAIALVKATFESGFVNNCVLEFVGPGMKDLPIDFRNGIDVMTTETTCLSSIWVTDGVVENYFKTHKRPEAYAPLAPKNGAYYDSALEIDLSKVECMIALPFHPSNAYTVKEVCANAGDILRSVEKAAAEQLELTSPFTLTDKITPAGIRVDQGVIAGCAGGTFDNLCAAAKILSGGTIGDGAFALSAYPASQPVYMELIKNGAAADLMGAGVTLRTAFCGPCFGAGDVPANGGLSIRHSTRNFPNREGSKPNGGQIASVALMDARSIAATARNGGILTPATDIDFDDTPRAYTYDDSAYTSRVYNGWGKADAAAELKFGPNIADWPKMVALTDDLLLQVASVITDPVTTTDELIPSGETSSYRSNPEKLSSFALSRKDPGYVDRAKAIRTLEVARREGKGTPALADLFARLTECGGDPASAGIGTIVCARRPGDGSAREQAASCQKVLGGWANLATEYATKRYRSNLINWGMLPLTCTEDIADFAIGDWLYLPNVRRAVEEKWDAIEGFVVSGDAIRPIKLTVGSLTDDERAILLDGCLINHCRV